MSKTGRKNIADDATRKRVIAVKRSNPSMSNAQIAQRFQGVSTRQVQYWLAKAKERGEV